MIGGTLQCEKMREKNIPGRGKSQCKDLKAEMSLLLWQNRNIPKWLEHNELGKNGMNKGARVDIETVPRYWQIIKKWSVVIYGSVNDYRASSSLTRCFLASTSLLYIIWCECQCWGCIMSMSIIYLYPEDPKIPDIEHLTP